MRCRNNHPAMPNAVIPSSAIERQLHLSDVDVAAQAQLVVAGFAVIAEPPERGALHDSNDQ
jgi:hypothetical protein